jgi:hypothetical protein
LKQSPDKTIGPLAQQIVDYLSNQPNAQDTVDGIIEWWLLKQRVCNAASEVKRGLDRLVASGLVLVRTGQDGRVHYRADRRKRGRAAKRRRKS